MDVHGAGGIPAILELYRGGHPTDVHSVHSPSLEQYIADWDIRSGTATEEAIELFHAAPGGVRTTEPFSTDNRWESLDTDAVNGCIHSVEHPATAEGGLAVLRGNIAPNGSVFKTAGVSEENFRFSGPARVVESQEEAVSVILGKKLVAGEVLVVLYEGPAGGPGMQEMLHPTAFIKGAARNKVRAHHRRSVLRRFIRLVDRPYRAGGGRGRPDRPGAGRRHRDDRCGHALDQRGCRRRRAGPPSCGEGTAAVAARQA